MIANVTAIEAITPCEAISHNGTYRGKWSACTVQVVIRKRIYRLTTDMGVRGLNVPCNVEIKDGVITVRAIDKEPK